MPSGTPGFTVGPAYDKVGWHASDTHPLAFTGARVPEGNLLGERGRGFANFLHILDEGRIAIAARGEASFTVAFMPGLVVSDAVRELQRAFPDVTIEVVRTGWDDQVQVLHDGRADVGYLRRPFDAAGLSTEPLFVEPRVVVLPSDHALAGASGVLMDDLAEEHLLQDPAAVPEWAGVAAEMRRSRGTTRSPSRTVEEKLELVAVRQGIAILPLSTARFYRRPDVRYVPVADLPPTAVHLGWEQGRESRLLDVFVEAARDVGRPAA